jgi:hypothetical protein
MYRTRPTIMAISIRLERLAKTNIPKTESSQSKSKIAAISRKGEGRLPISPITRRKIKVSHRVTVLPLKRNKGILNVAIGPYPRNQKTIRSKRMAISIFFYFRLPI